MEVIHKFTRIAWQPMVGVGATLLTQGWWKEKPDWMMYGAILCGIPAIYYFWWKSTHPAPQPEPVIDTEFEETADPATETKELP